MTLQSDQTGQAEQREPGTQQAPAGGVDRIAALLRAADPEAGWAVGGVDGPDAVVEAGPELRERAGAGFGSGAPGRAGAGFGSGAPGRAGAEPGAGEWARLASRARESAGAEPGVPEWAGADSGATVWPRGNSGATGAGANASVRERAGAEAGVREGAGAEPGVPEWARADSGATVWPGVNSGATGAEANAGVRERAGAEAGVPEWAGADSAATVWAGANAGVRERAGAEAGVRERAGVEARVRERGGGVSGAPRQVGVGSRGGERGIASDAGGLVGVLAVWPVVGMLVDAGELALHTPLTAYGAGEGLPAGTTAHQLLTHGSGASPALVGLVERLCGSPLAGFAAERIWGPLGMTRTGFAADGTLCASAADLGRFLSHLLAPAGGPVSPAWTAQSLRIRTGELLPARGLLWQPSAHGSWSHGEGPALWISPRGRRWAALLPTTPSAPLRTAFRDAVFA
ncbi:hypothetical protein [Streptomyces sp. NPDC002104]